MRLSRRAAVLLLIATVVPLGYAVCFMGFVLSMVLMGPKMHSAGPWVLGVVVLHMLCIAWIWALIAAYLVILFKTGLVPDNFKAVWAIVLIFGNVIAMLAFWAVYLCPMAQWQRPDASTDGADP